MAGGLQCGLDTGADTGLTTSYALMHGCRAAQDDGPACPLLHMHALHMPAGLSGSRADFSFSCIADSSFLDGGLISYIFLAPALK